MPESPLPASRRPERAFLDANVIRGQLTNDVLLSVAYAGAFEPRWSQQVLDEMRRNRPPNLPEQAIDSRIATMNKAFPRAMTSGYDGLESSMQADPKDRHVLAAAVHSGSDVLVTDNVKDFNPPTSGVNAMRVERLSEFLSRKLDENPERVQAGLQAMVDRNWKKEPRSMPALLDQMADQQELRAFAQKLNAVVPADQRGTSELLTAGQRNSAQHAALDGVARPGTTQAPATAPEARKSSGGQGVEKAKDTDHGK